MSAVLRIEITNKSGLRVFEFEGVEQLYAFDGGRVTCDACGWNCGGVGGLIIHLADNCGESATVGAFLKRLESRRAQKV